MDALSYEKFANIENFFNLLFEFNIIPTIFKPTRITNQSSSVIDNILTNCSLNNKFESGLFIADFSDHFPVFHIAREVQSNIDNKKCFVTYRNLSIKNLNNFKNKLQVEQWDKVYLSTDPSIAFDHFSNTLQSIFDNVCPKITTEIKNKKYKNPWMTITLIKASKRKQKLYVKFLKSKNKVDEKIYKYYKKFFQHTPCFYIVQPNKTFDKFLGEKPTTSLNNETITKIEFNKAIIELKRNKSCGYDGISSNVAIYIMDSISKPLFYLISFSFENSIFPNKLKLAKINPILKKGDCINVSNYRPISLLPVLSSTLNNLLYKNQFGFQSRCSTEHAIIKLADKIFKSFDSDELVLGVFVDLSKAFDTVDHSILLSKLKY
ncbi:uncharacterized protein LOC136095558 [Hydra vulgaris]|uniref:uncharacterized protein LOC136095558 n=1 Tax=Hydra vulgaris TaxID=6087 RepID=UPI0032EA70FC